MIACDAGQLSTWPFPIRSTFELSDVSQAASELTSTSHNRFIWVLAEIMPALNYPDF